MDELTGFQIEEVVKEKLEKEHGKKFSKRKITIGNYDREIDLLSDDGEIAVQVKSGKDFSSSGRISPYRFAEICIDCLILMASKSPKKLMILTDKGMLEQFNKESGGLPIFGVELKLIEC
ncbi:hypothetical protein QVH35_11665 [Candidatus Nitrosotenuis chungbukensis]|uniref:hypothetical protein n=1 Tax=Candidatus Nitrosotenuis chungbukensis TaxID=1353246 RepID=UPI0005B2CA81|nr:hypothetical protein [Candidatus Nitrosotenuis chungbukensis]WKT57923.1 hypothetical protein QVH35_11665 [Candidatus Nitrosotenuis chungbukensis]